jgi:type II secretory pathway component PulC
MLRAFSAKNLLVSASFATVLLVGCASAPKTEGPLLTSARFENVVNAGQVSAVRLRDIQPGSGWEKFGFREGDLVTAIDGKPITQQDDVFHLLEAMAVPGLHEIQVSRAVSGRLENLRVRSAR